MKKMMLKMLGLVLVAVCALFLVGCSSYNTVKKAFEKEEYTENKDLDSVTKKIKEELEKEDFAIELHLLCKNGELTNNALIIEFKSTEKMVEAYESSDTIKGIVSDVKNSEDINEVYKALEEAGYAKGNCLIIPLTVIHASEIKGIVKSIK